jgi:uncharacterized membrane protein YgdD (TMEM256/DUF423 family)
MERVFFVLGAVLAGMGVIAGAFGAHGLRGHLTPELLGVFETGVRYHLIHALGLLAVAWAMTRWPGAATSTAGWLFLAGILLFSGSLYGLSLSGLRWLGAITPIGGVAWVVGWLVLGWGVWQGR